MSTDEESDDRPLYSIRRKRMLRAVVLLAVAAMLLPIVASLITASANAAVAACARTVAYSVPDAPSSTVRFELFGPGVIGWECYTAGAFGGDSHVISLGLVPGWVALPTRLNS